MSDDLDRDRNRCLEIIRAAGGKPVSLGRLRKELGKNLAMQPAINVLTSVIDISHYKRKNKVYFISSHREP